MNRAAPLNELGTATLRSQKKPLTRPRILPLDIFLQISAICLEISVRLILQKCTLGCNYNCTSDCTFTCTLYYPILYI